MALTTIVNQEDKAMDAKNQILAKKANRQKPSNQANQLASFNTQVLGGKDKMRPTPSLVPFTTEVVNGGNNRRPISNQAPVDQILAKPQSPAEQADLLAPYDTEIITGKGNPLTRNMMPTSNLQTPTQQQSPAGISPKQMQELRDYNAKNAPKYGEQAYRDTVNEVQYDTLMENERNRPFGTMYDTLKEEVSWLGQNLGIIPEQIREPEPVIAPSNQTARNSRYDSEDYDDGGNSTYLDADVALANDATAAREQMLKEQMAAKNTEGYEAPAEHITDFTDEMMKVEPPKTIFDTSGGAMVPDSKVTPGAKDYIATPDGWRLKEEVMPAGNSFGPQNIQDYKDKTGYIPDADPKMVKRRAEAQAVHDNRVALNNEQARDREIMESKRNATFGSTGSVAGSTLGVNPNRVVNSNNARREAARAVKNKKAAADLIKANAAQEASNAAMFNAGVNRQKIASDAKLGERKDDTTRFGYRLDADAAAAETEADRYKTDTGAEVANYQTDTQAQTAAAELKQGADESNRDYNLRVAEAKANEANKAELNAIAREKNSFLREQKEREYVLKRIELLNDQQKAVLENFIDAKTGRISDFQKVAAMLEQFGLGPKAYQNIR